MELPPRFSPDNSAAAREQRMAAQRLRNTSDFTSYDHALAWMQYQRPVLKEIITGEESAIQPATEPGHSDTAERPERTE